MKISQFHEEVVQINGRDICSYVYNEFGSKNCPGVFNSLNSDNKSVRQYENTAGAICHVKILEKYLQKIPDEARSADNFYLTPVAVLPSDPAKPWFTKVPVGQNTLNKMLKEMSQEAGLSQTYTNHSLRVYSATTLSHREAPEKLIQQCTGHKSLNTLRQYERTTEIQLLDVSNVLSNNGKFTDVVPGTKGDDALQHYVGASQGDVSTNTSNVMVQKSSRKPIAATMILRECNFTNCNIAFSGSVEGGNGPGDDRDVDDLLEGISIGDTVQLNSNLALTRVRLAET